MGLAWSSREGWGRAGNPTPSLISPLSQLCWDWNVWLFLRAVCLYVVQMARAFLNLL